MLALGAVRARACLMMSLLISRPRAWLMTAARSPTRGALATWPDARRALAAAKRRREAASFANAPGHLRPRTRRERQAARAGGGGVAALAVTTPLGVAGPKTRVATPPTAGHSGNWRSYSARAVQNFQRFKLMRCPTPPLARCKSHDDRCRPEAARRVEPVALLPRQWPFGNALAQRSRAPRR